MRSLGANPVLVHGGGPYINAWLEKLNVPAQFEEGLRVTDARTLDVVRMVLLGQVNAGLVLLASQLGCKAIGLSGTVANIIKDRLVVQCIVIVCTIQYTSTTCVHTLLVLVFIPLISPA